MISAGVVGRPPAVSNNSRSRLGGYTQQNSDSTAPLGARLSNGTIKGINDSIWGNGSLTIGSISRDRSRNRDTASRLGASEETIDGKTGSGALVDSSTTDSFPQPSAWSRNNSVAHVRSQDVSPVRHRSIGNALPLQTGSFGFDGTQPASSYSAHRASVPTNTYKPLAPNGNSSNANFFTRQSESISGPTVGGFSRIADIENQNPVEQAKMPWADGGSVYSPVEDRRGSIQDSQYFGRSSTTTSRNGSLPPSRHGSEPVQYPQAASVFTSRFPSFSGAPPRNPPSQANGRGYQEVRVDSVLSDSGMFDRLNINDDIDGSVVVHKPAVSANGYSQHQFTQGSVENGYQRQSISDETYGYDSQSGITTSGHYTPNGYPAGALGDRFNAYRDVQFQSRNSVTPNGNSHRQSPYYPAGGTPPVFDHLYPSRSDATSRAMLSNNQTALENKLRALQQVQATQTYLDPTHPQYAQFLAQHFRNPYNQYMYAMPNSMQMNGFVPGIPMPMPVMMPGMLPDIPKGPRQEPEGTSIMSARLNDFKSNSKNRRWELKDIYEHIVEFSGDQHGSRFIQHKLETANSDEKERVFREIQQNEIQLMQDVFGNYVIQKFFEHGDQNQKKHLASRMKGRVYDLTRQMYGCRVVQKALEHVLADQQAELVKELDGNVINCVMDQNGNHVIQKAIERIPAEHIRFIVDAFRGNLKKMAIHPYGCRVIQRMLEHCDQSAKRQILNELHGCDANVSTDQFGNYVTQHMIEYGEPEDRTKIIEKVKSSLLVLCRHKFASNVVEKCIVYGTEEERRGLMLKICEKVDPTNPHSETNLLLMCKDGYGNYVIQRLLEKLTGEDNHYFLERLQMEVPKVKKVIPGKHIAAIEKKLHRFDPGQSSCMPLSPTTDLPQGSRGTTPSLSSPQSDSVPSTTLSSNPGADLSLGYPQTKP